MKKLIASIAVLLLLTTVYAIPADAADVYVDTDGVNDGIVGISYNGEADTRYKVMISKGSEEYYYDYFGPGIEYFPLQNGNGNYKISFLELMSGTKYKVIYTKNINAEIESDTTVFLQSVQNVNWNSEMETVALANELVKGLTSDKDKVEAIYLYIVSNIKYDYEKINTVDSRYIPDVEGTLKSKKGICYDYSALFASMLRSQGIPAKLIKGYTDNVEGYHAWNEVLIDGQWVIIDTTYDAMMRSYNSDEGYEKNHTEYRIARVY
ncbi:MAG TPA: transglutaminase [Ruminiclostridium sp.]|jgi:transglutaminase-like putative cysteine protease|nr:transglutaminase domain-containing protein [Clostridiaceae bacterium]HAA24757.1 transglutaminase [Ruminiclostridium sp.]